MGRKDSNRLRQESELARKHLALLVRSVVSVLPPA
jgi:hypothetical protein